MRGVAFSLLIAIPFWLAVGLIVLWQAGVL